MKLFTKCNSCKEEILIKSNASTRPDLEIERGEKFVVNCTSCGRNLEKHVNDIKAKENNFFIIGGVVLSIIVTLVLWNFFGAVGTISGAIPILIWKQQNNAVHAFNSYRVRRT